MTRSWKTNLYPFGHTWNSSSIEYTCELIMNRYVHIFGYVLDLDNTNTAFSVWVNSSGVNQPPCTLGKSYLFLTKYPLPQGLR